MRANTPLFSALLGSVSSTHIVWHQGASALLLALACGLPTGSCTKSGSAAGTGGVYGGAGKGGAGAAVSGTGGAVSGTGGASTGAGGVVAGTGGAVSGTGGRAATGGSGPGAGGRTVATGGRTGMGGSITGRGGVTTQAGTGGASADAGGSTDAAAPGTACTMGTWPTADPSKAGPFATTTENNVGPPAGVGVDGGAPPQFTLFRPKDLAESGLCHPLITWGNGHGTTPSTYSALLTRLASHGFVVIASNSSTVSQGSPAPMLVGVTWILEQNADSTSELYQRIDTTHIGATGQSEGAMATASAGADSRIVTIAPICNGSNARNLHGPALLLCGGQDTTLPCSGSVSALNSLTTEPAMAADYLTATHTSWMTFGNAALSPMELAVVAWMRVQLMGDTALRPTFYGTSCTLCTDSAWQITQNSLMNQ